MSQDAQLTRAAQTRSSSTAAAAAAALQEQTPEQPAVTPPAAGSSSSPVDLSNKKSPEAETNTETPAAAASAAAAAAAPGKYQTPPPSFSLSGVPPVSRRLEQRCPTSNSERKKTKTEAKMVGCCSGSRRRSFSLTDGCSLRPQAPLASLSTHWGVSPLLTWPKTRRDSHLDRKVGSTHFFH